MKLVAALILMLLGLSQSLMSFAVPSNTPSIWEALHSCDISDVSGSLEILKVSQNRFQGCMFGESTNPIRRVLVIVTRGLPA